MAADAAALMRQEYRAAKRLTRLFRIERTGGFARWPDAVVRRLIDRRGELIDELLRLEKSRRSLEPWIPTELELAMGALGREVGAAEQRCLERLAELGAELQRRRGRVSTGLRAGTAGQLLGRG